MKTFFTVLKVLAALAAIGTAVYLGVAYGKQIAAWIKRILKLEPEEFRYYEGSAEEVEEAVEEDFEA